MAAGSRRQTPLFAVAAPAIGQAVIRLLDMNGGELRERQVSEGRSEEVVDYLTIPPRAFWERLPNALR